MLQAGTSGAFDFASFNPHEERSWLRLHLILDEVQKQNELRLYDMLHRQIVSQLSNTALKQESLDSAWSSALEVYNYVKQIRFPWQIDEKQDSDKPKHKFGEVRDAWSTAFGDLDDPKIKAQIEATARWLTESARANQQGSEPDGISR